MKLIILNHKMNLYYEDVDNYITNINKINRNLIIAPSSIYLIEFLKKCRHLIASQDICYIDEGNQTGKISWKQISHLGIKYSIIGHSEKHDDIDKVNTKLNVCLSNNIKPILCITNNNMDEDIINVLKKIDINNIENVIFAYEPIFNIGADYVDIDYIKHEIIKMHNYLNDKYKTKPTIIYGGGINQDNINEIYNIELLSGIMIGGISANIQEIEKLLLMINEK